MTDAEHALREAAADIPAEVRERLDTAEKLSDEDRETIIEIARQSLASLPAQARSRRNGGSAPARNKEKS
jgi:F-type H+-transporting ATPase subunit alpha